MENKEFIPYEEALAMKELGFDEPTICFYRIQDFELHYDTILQTKNPIFRNNTSRNIYNDLLEKISAPLYQQTFRWFRDKYDLTHFIDKQITDGEFISAIIKNNGYHKNTTWAKYHPYLVADEDGNGVIFKTYEEAELACLRKLIEIVKENKDGK